MAAQQNYGINMDEISIIKCLLGTLYGRLTKSDVPYDECKENMRLLEQAWIAIVNIKVDKPTRDGWDETVLATHNLIDHLKPYRSKRPDSYFAEATAEKGDNNGQNA